MWNNESVLAGQCAQWIERAPVKAICTSRSLMLPGAPVPAIPRGRGAFASLPPKATCPFLNSFHRSAGNLSPVGDSCAGMQGSRGVGRGSGRWACRGDTGGLAGSRRGRGAGRVGRARCFRVSVPVPSRTGTAFFTVRRGRGLAAASGAREQRPPPRLLRVHHLFLWPAETL
jgi:hypothetical protein